MLLAEKIRRFSRKSRDQQIHAVKWRLRHLYHIGARRFGINDNEDFPDGSGLALPKILHSRRRAYLAWRPDSDIDAGSHPELRELCDAWLRNNVRNNAGDLPRLYALAFNIKQVIAEGVAGDFAELGVYRGNSAAVLAHYARRHGRTVFLFDTFAGFEAKDLAGVDANKKHEFADTSLDLVRANVGDGAVVYAKGYFPATVTGDMANRRFAVAHLDCDLYEPIRAGLEFFYPRLAPGGLLVIHDYANPYWDGVKRAVDEFTPGIPESLIVIPDKSGTAMIRKTR